MFSRSYGFTLALAAVVALGLLSQAEAAKGKSPKPAGKVEGVLEAVSDSGVVIRKQNGTLVTLQVTATTKVELNDVRVPVTSLPLGSRTQALYDPATMVASKVESAT
jgi:hypothetical protein